MTPQISATSNRNIQEGLPSHATLRRGQAFLYISSFYLWSTIFVPFPCLFCYLSLHLQIPPLVQEKMLYKE